MSVTPDELLKLVPSVLEENVINLWSEWVLACETKTCSVDIDYPHANIGALWACSDFVARVCIKNPADLHDLIAHDIKHPRSFEDYQQLVSELLSVRYDDVKLMQMLRQFRHKEMMRIAWRDLDGLATQQQILQEISDLAEVTVSSTLTYLQEDMLPLFGDAPDENGEPQTMLVLAMGKMGGRELNFSSDIDLIFCYGTDGETNGKRKLSNHEYFTRLAQKLVKILNQVTADGFVYRVDTRLRPYGDSGPFVCSFAAMEQYYQQQGRDWERYAMIKAKVITGGEADVSYLQSMLKPFVYRRYLDYSAFESIREMKSMIMTEVKRKGLENNIKLGWGGIREIEFIGQTFQLIRGGRDTELQARGIISILDSLLTLRLLNDAEVSSLKAAYYFHRTLENRLQMERDAQTHMIPDSDIGRAKLCLAMRVDDWQQLSADIEVHRKKVNKVFQSILFSEDESLKNANPLNAFWFDNKTDGQTEALFEQWLVGSGLSEAGRILEALKAFKVNARVRALNEKSTKRLIKLLINVFDIISADAEKSGANGDSVNKKYKDSVTVLDRVLDVLLMIVGRQVYINLLIEYPRVLDLMVSLCASSHWFSSQLSRYPILLDNLLDTNYLHSISSQQDLALELDQLLSAVDENDLELQMERLRQFKQTQVLRVATLDVDNKVEVTEVAHTLSDVASVICQKVLALVWDRLVKKYGEPQCEVNGESRSATMGIIAYGKMGGDELGYSSDLDVVFLHNSEGENQLTSGRSDGSNSIDNMSFFIRVAQKVIHMMETYMHSGRLYEIDTRLRPDGRAGLMAIGLKAFELYQLEKAWTWEHQALIRARVIAGAAPIHQEFARIRKQVLQRELSCEKITLDVVEMREKMRQHLASKDSEAFNYKQDAGGLVDIEFIVQAGVLCRAFQAPQLLDTTSTLQLLKRLPDCGWLSLEEADYCQTAYKDYRLAVNRQSLEIAENSDLQAQQLEQYRVRICKLWDRIMLQKQ